MNYNISTPTEFIRYSSLPSSRYKLRGERLFISPPRHTISSQPELVISFTSRGVLANYYGSKYRSSKDAINDCGVNFNSIVFAPYRTFTPDYSNTGARV